MAIGVVLMPLRRSHRPWAAKPSAIFAWQNVRLGQQEHRGSIRRNDRPPWCHLSRSPCIRCNPRICPTILSRSSDSTAERRPGRVCRRRSDHRQPPTPARWWCRVAAQSASTAAASAVGWNPCKTMSATSTIWSDLAPQLSFQTLLRRRQACHHHPGQALVAGSVRRSTAEVFGYSPASSRQGSRPCSGPSSLLRRSCRYPGFRSPSRAASWGCPRRH